MWLGDEREDPVLVQVKQYPKTAWERMLAEAANCVISHARPWLLHMKAGWCCLVQIVVHRHF